MFGKGLPHFAIGDVVKGFGRGSKQLGIPTANFPVEVVRSLPKDISTGVYFGFASVDNGPVYKMVLSIGWNPYYKNTEKSMETHIMNEFDEDFYGKKLKIVILGYLRSEQDFSSLDDLIKAIKDDIDNANKKLDLSEYIIFKDHEFFTNQNIR